MHRWPFCARHGAHKVISGVTLQQKHRCVLEFTLYKNHVALTASQQNEKWDKSTMWEGGGDHLCAGTQCNSQREKQVHTCDCRVPSSPPCWRQHFSPPQPALANQHPHKAVSLHAHGPEPGGTCGCWCDTARRESSKRCTEDHKEHRGGVGGEETRPGFPFNLLINHANEILTGYSEAFLRGAWKALVPDYTLSM